MSDPGAKDDREDRWLVARERGEDIGHVPAAARAPYERLGALLGSGSAPSAGFRQRVLDAIDAAERAASPAPAPAPTTEPATPASGIVPIRQRKRLRRIWIAGGLAAAAAAAAVAVVQVSKPSSGGAGPDQTVALATEVRRDHATAQRADHEGTDQASLGDTLVVHAEASGPAEVRVYGGSGQRLLARCDDRSGCTVERDGERRRFTLEVRLDAPGTARAVIFLGADLPASAGSLDPDLEAATRARIEYKPSQRTRVR